MIGPLLRGKLDIEILCNKRAGEELEMKLQAVLFILSLCLCMCVWLPKVVVGVCVCEFVSLNVIFENTYPRTSCLKILLLDLVQCKDM